jgi:predicted PurR-regulated permease PerM
LLAIDPKAARVTWTAAVTLLFLAAIYAVRGTLVVFAIALLVAYLLHPLVGLLSRPFPLKSRTLALALTYIIVMGALVSITVVIGSHVAGEARHLIANPPDYQGFLDSLAAAHPAFSPTLESFRGSINQQVGKVATAAPQLTQEFLEASSNLIYLIVIPILSFFILKDGASIRDAFLATFSAGEKRARVAATLAEVHVLLLQYMRALLVLCCTALVVIGLGLTAMGVHYALLLASFSFFCEFVPMAGPVAEIVVILTVSALTGYQHVWAIAAGLGVFRLVQDYVIWPRLMSRGVELHPLLVIFGVFAGGQIGGVAGVFFAVPALALARLTLIPVGTSHSAPARRPVRPDSGKPLAER